MSPAATTVVLPGVRTAPHAGTPPREVPPWRPGGAHLPAGAGALLTAALARPGQTRRVSDLLAGLGPGGSGGGVHLAYPQSARRPACRRGPAGGDPTGGDEDPVLYLAHRDVLAPRPKASHTECTLGGSDRSGAARAQHAGVAHWFADLVVYPAARLGDGPELSRSLGHWNTPGQIEIFQCLSGRVLMLHTGRDEHGHPAVYWQVCEPGEHLVVGFGAWHLTVVLDAPAAVFNIYTDVSTAELRPAELGPAELSRTGLPGPHDPRRVDTSRDAAVSGRKYRTAPAPQLGVVCGAHAVEVITAAVEQQYRCLRAGRTPDWARALLEPSGLAALYQHAPEPELARLQQHAVHFADTVHAGYTVQGGDAVHLGHAGDGHGAGARRAVVSGCPGGSS